MKNRRTLGVDLELAEELKSIARSRGMSLVGYLRKLFEEAIEIERLGYFAPSALREKKTELMLSKLGFVYIPLDLLDIQSANPEVMETRGEKLGATLRELEISCEEIIERISLSNGIGILRENTIILIPSSGPKELLRRFLIGLARGSSLEVSIVGDLAIIKTSRFL
ncbi:MAG: CopG family transcriptional regulator [Zestosphaera sp.]